MGRGYLAAFLRRGIRLAAISPRGFLYDAAFPLPAGIVELPSALARTLPEPDVGLGCIHPPRLDRLRGRLRANLFVWEADRVPPAWVELLAAGADVIIVPSSFTRDALVLSGFPGEKIEVVRYGHDIPVAGDSEVPALDRAPERPFTFLCVASPHRRKGVLELLAAYAAAFRIDDSVLLRIKTTYDPGAARTRRSFEIPSWARALEEAGLGRAGAPAVDLVVARCSDEEARGLYLDADVVVAPSWGESFGLAILEGLASGKPVVTTGWGGALDFLPPGPDLLPFRTIEGGDALYEPVSGALQAVPDVDALRQRLRWHFEHREESAALGRVALQAAAALTWDAAAADLFRVLKKRSG